MLLKFFISSLTLFVITQTITAEYYYSPNYNKNYQSYHSHQTPKFTSEYVWTHANFTWPSYRTYRSAIDSRQYVPENVVIVGFKFHADRIYVTTPRIKTGVPATLNHIPAVDTRKKRGVKRNQLLTPYPSWSLQALPKSTIITTDGLNNNQQCSNLLSVFSLEIDTDGVIWAMDGYRINPETANCPCKLVLIDADTGRFLHSHIMDQTVCLNNAAFMNDIVVEGTQYAYMTDSSSLDPGIVVYSRTDDRSYKMRDPSAFPVNAAAGILVGELVYASLMPIDGIALTPAVKNVRSVNSDGSSNSRYLYYSPLTGWNLYRIDTSILKDDRLRATGNWRYNVTNVGQKQSQGDGMVFDNKGVLYYTLLPIYAVGRWNSSQRGSFTDNSEILDESEETMIWADSLAFDANGYLYLMSNHIHEYFDESWPLRVDENYNQFHLLRTYTGARSYLY